MRLRGITGRHLQALARPEYGGNSGALLVRTRTLGGLATIESTSPLRGIPRPVGV